MSSFPDKLSKLDLAVIQETHPEWVIRKLAQEARLLRDENERLRGATARRNQAARASLPWTVKEWDNGDIDVLCDGGRVASVDTWVDSNRTNANAKLIAAAPALADALQLMLQANEEDVAFGLRAFADADAALRAAGRLT